MEVMHGWPMKVSFDLISKKIYFFKVSSIFPKSLIYFEIVNQNIRQINLTSGLRKKFIIIIIIIKKQKKTKFQNNNNYKQKKKKKKNSKKAK